LKPPLSPPFVEGLGPSPTRRKRSKPVAAGGPATIDTRPKAASFSVTVVEAAHGLSTNDLVVLSQQQGTASVAWNGMRKLKMRSTQPFSFYVVVVFSSMLLARIVNVCSCSSFGCRAACAAFSHIAILAQALSAADPHAQLFHTAQRMHQQPHRPTLHQQAFLSQHHA